MRDTDYSEAKTLDDIFEINRKEWDKPLQDRNELLMDLASKSESICELGINQGTSFALMMLQKPKLCVGVDIHLWKWRFGNQGIPPLAPLAEKFAAENGMELKMHEGSSIAKKAVHKVDMLHIDSLHKPTHLENELRMHATAIKKYIVFHDTKLDNRETGGEYAMWKVVEKFLEDNDQWELIEHYTEGKAGHAAIKRVS